MSPPANNTHQLVPTLHSPTPTPASARAQTVSRACTRCRRFKSRCVSGPEGEGAACRRCLEAEVDCVYAQPPHLPNVQVLGNAERIARLERHHVDQANRQLLYEHALRSLGIDINDLLAGQSLGSLQQSGGKHEEVELSSSMHEALSPEPGYRTAELISNDLTKSDALRFGRGQETERSTSCSGRPTKRRRQSRDAEEPDQELQQLAFRIFGQRCSVSLPFIDVAAPDHTPEAVSAKSSLLYWSLVAVGAREAKELSHLHDYARARALAASRMTLGGRLPSFDDIKGYCVFLYWLSPMRPIGHLVSLVFELDLHRAYLALSTDSSSSGDLDRVRVFCFTLVQDRLMSIATGNPHSNLDVDLLAQCEALVQHPCSTVRDGRLCAQAELTLIIMNEKRNHLDHTDFVMAADFAMLQLQNELIDRWGVKWRSWALLHAFGEGVFTPFASILVQFPFAKLHVNSVVLRRVKTSADMTSERLVYAHVAVNHAQEMLRVAIEHFQAPIICYVSEYTHLQTTHAAVFLLKIIRLLPQAFDVHTIFLLLRQVIQLLAQVRGRFHSESLRLLLQHVEAELATPLPVDSGNTNETRQPQPPSDLLPDLLIGNQVPTGDSTDSALRQAQGNAQLDKRSSASALPAAAWKDLAVTPGFWGFEEQGMVGGDIGFNLFGGWETFQRGSE